MNVRHYIRVPIYSTNNEAIPTLIAVDVIDTVYFDKPGNQHVIVTSTSMGNIPTPATEGEITEAMQAAGCIIEPVVVEAEESETSEAEA